MNILHLATHAGVFRGGAVQLCRMALAQRKLGHSVRIVAQDGYPFGRSAEERERKSWDGVVAEGVPVDQFSFLTPSGVLALRRYFAEHAIEIVHAHRDDALIAANLALAGLRRPILVAQRGTTSTPPWPASRYFKAEKTRAIVAVAADVKRALVEEAGVDTRKVHVIYGSVDLEKFAPRAPHSELLDGLKLPEGARIVGSLSAYRRAKGFEEMIEALGRALPKHPDAYALFLGNRTDKKVRKLAKQAGIRDRCRFVGHQANVADWISAMEFTVVAATSREGLSGVLRESLAMEVPVVTTDCSGNREIVRNGETGLLVPVGDVDALAAAFDRALSEPDEMKRMARAGRAWVVENCSTERQSTRLIALYESLLADA